MGLFRGPTVAQLQEQRDFAGLARVLCGGDAASRADAARAITELASTDAVAPIVDAVDGIDDDAVLDIVGQTLHDLGAPAAQALVGIVDRGLSDPAMVAIALLGRIGEPDGLAALGDLIQRAAGDTRDAVTTRSLSALALGSVGTPGAIDLVLGLLDDPTSPVRLAAAMTLERHPDPRAADALRRLGDDPDPAVRDQAAKALDALGGR